MKISGKIILIFILLFVACHTGFAQSNTVQTDSLQLNKQKKESAGEDGLQARNGSGGMQNRNGNSGRTVKQVRSGRPDMTRARGARPPMIVRPSGSGIPKGVGRPGGAGRKGGR